MDALAQLQDWLVRASSPAVVSQQKKARGRRPVMPVAAAGSLVHEMRRSFNACSAQGTEKRQSRPASSGFKL